MGQFRHAMAFGFGIAVLTAGPLASAAELRFSWTAPADCPSSEAVASRVARPEKATAKDEPLEAEGTVERKDERFRLTLRTKRGDARGERTLEAATCEGLADATAVVLAVAIAPADDSPDATTPTVVKTEAPKATIDPTATRDADRAAPPAASRDVLREHELAVGAALTTDTGSMPATAAGGSLSVAWTPGRFRLEGLGALYGAQTRTTETGNAGADLQLLVFGGRACWAALVQPVEVGPCVGGAASLLSATGFGAKEENFDTGARWATATAGAQIRFPIASWAALRGGVDALAAITRPRFVVEGDGAVHQPTALGLRAHLGGELLFF